MNLMLWPLGSLDLNLIDHLQAVTSIIYQLQLSYQANESNVSLMSLIKRLSVTDFFMFPPDSFLKRDLCK